MDMKVNIRMMKRYMYDARTLLHPLRAGWRVKGGGLWFKKSWKEEDTHLSSTEITKRVVLESMNGIEDFLTFTGESCEDFCGEWLPTLDTNMRRRPAPRGLFRRDQP